MILNEADDGLNVLFDTHVNVQAIVTRDLAGFKKSKIQSSLLKNL